MYLAAGVLLVGIVMRNGIDDDILLAEGSALLAAVSYFEWRFPINVRRQRAGKPVFFGMLFVMIGSLIFWLIDQTRAWPG